MVSIGQPEHIHTPSGGLFALFHPAAHTPSAGMVLHLPPFAEELNTCRRVSAQAARAMAQAGWSVCQFDPSGCGDSGGELDAARWADWIDDALATLQTGLTRWPLPPGAPICLWGVRSGALLAAHVCARLAERASETSVHLSGHPIHLMWWQPVLSGKLVLQQWLRLHSAQAWLGHTSGQTTSPAQSLAQGHAVSVGGYPISAALAQDLNAATCPAPTMPTGHLIWLDVQEGATASLSTERGLDTWRQAGWAISWRPIVGPAFWQSIGQEDAPGLLEVSVQSLKTLESPPG
jgi:uncharacterized protein